jgi:hypothetical protein
MRSKTPLLFALLAALTLAGAPAARAQLVTLSHTASALPGAAPPAITLSSITGNNNGSNYIFTLTFSNATIEGPSANKADSVYGFIDLDADRNAGTGVTGAALDSGGLQPGFGHFSPSSLGIDAYLNLSSEGDPLHGAPGRVDLVKVNGTNPVSAIPVATIPVTYANQSGSTPSTMTITIPLSDFTANGIPLSGAGSFSVIVGNQNNATDFLAPTAVPEPGAVTLVLVGVSLTVAVSRGRRVIARVKRSRPGL